jgi:hypothetical protein
MGRLRPRRPGPVDPVSAHATCDHCGLVKRLTSTGTLTLHFLKFPERVRNLQRTRRVRRACPGSGRPPRRVER